MSKVKIIQLSFLFFFTYLLVNANDVKNVIQKANQLNASGKSEEAIALLDSSYKSNNNSELLYQISVIYYSKRNYNDAVPYLEKIIDEKGARPEYYQLLGSCYDFLGQKKQALFTLNTGIEIFPKSGKLYYELGLTHFGKQNKTMATKFWEKGITYEPRYMNNYYRLTKVYNESENKLLTLIYGETYLLLANNPKRQQEISQLIYNIYVDLISNHVNGKAYTLSEVDPNSNEAEKVEKPFISFYQDHVLDALKKINPKEAGLSTVIQFRKVLLDLWKESGYAYHYPVALIDHHLKVMDNSNYEAYSYIILSSGDNESFNSWAKNNMQSVQSVAAWMQKNPLIINNDNSFFKIKYHEE